MSAIMPMPDPIPVLIVEDDKDTAESTAMVLGLWGIATSIARDGPAALAALDGSVPDIVLLDLGLQGMSGFEVAERMRSSPRFDRTMIVVMSGYAGRKVRQRAMAAGCQHLIVKPVDLDRLHLLLLDGLKEFRRNDASHTCTAGGRPGSSR